MEQQLQSLGADVVLTYDDLADKGLKDQVKSITRGKESTVSYTAYCKHTETSTAACEADAQLRGWQDYPQDGQPTRLRCIRCDVWCHV